MAHSRYYDTVAFDVRDNATMLFFASTNAESDIEDYLLLMRTVDENFDESIYVEVNEQQFGGHNLLAAAELVGNTLKLTLREPVPELDNASQIVLTYAESAENLAAIESGAFRVLGESLKGGNA